MSEAVPVCSAQDSLESIRKGLEGMKWDDLDHVFVLDKSNKVMGIVDLAASSILPKETLAEKMMMPVEGALNPEEPATKCIVYALKNDVDIVPIEDKESRFLGAILAKTIIDVMHQEHLERMFRVSGIYKKKSDIAKLAIGETFEVFKSRIIWLIMGLFVGLGLGVISSFFEESLQKNISLAFFIPVVAYIADSVGTQSEAIAVRALAFLRVSSAAYLLRELAVGQMLGVCMGFFGGMGAVLITGQPYVGLVVGLSLFTASTFAAVLASFIPILFKQMGYDPALGSGPLATALQDVLSIVIYFLFALLLLQ